MESWMKRGVLQNPKNSSKPHAALAPKNIVQVDSRPKAAANSSNKQQDPPPSMGIKIPCVPNDFGEFVIFPAQGDFPAAWGESIKPTVTRLPFHGTPYTVSLLYPGAKEAIAAIPGFPTPYVPSPRMCHRIGDAPGAGKGVFALTDLDVGDVILSERPLCLVPQRMGNTTMTEKQLHMTALSLVTSMDPQDVKDFFELTTCKPGVAGDPILGIISTNGLDASRMPGDYNGQYVGICRDLCRVNHRSVDTR